jgi:uncharacterized membrane protein
MTLGYWLPWLALVPIFSGAVMLFTIPSLAYRASAVLFAWAEAMEYFTERLAAHAKKVEAGNESK